MLCCRRGECIIDQIKVQSKLGHGILYLLNCKIALEISKKGLCLELGYDEINLSISKKDNFLISWNKGADRYDIKFNAKNATLIMDKINQNKNNFFKMQRN